MKLKSSVLLLTILTIIINSCGETSEKIIFPQGVASGDPTPESIIIWTRAVPSEESSVMVNYQIARDPDFKEIVKSGVVTTSIERDYTIHVKISGLSPFTHYYYRFISGKYTSPTGRTLTAPAPDSDVQVKFAVAYGQSYVGRYFKAYSLMLTRDSDIDFVLFLGDYVYEATYVKDAIVPTPDRFLKFPDGGMIISSGYYGATRVAWTLEDYRTLYRVWRSDPDLQEIHRNFPFIVMWDDHEFANDCWRDHAENFNGRIGDENETERREAATRAFYEYMPVDVEYHPEKGYPDDITLYRSFRYGKNVEIFLTDQRYYRDPPAIPPGPVNLETGKIMANNILGARILVPKEAYDSIESKARPTMLGHRQLNWLISGIKNSTAKWKVIGNPTMLSQFLIDLRNYDLPPNLRKLFYFKLDQWDGYRSERRYLLKELEGTENVVFLTGDLHASIASPVYVDYDLPVTPVAVEYMGPSISSVSLQEQLKAALDSSPLLQIVGKISRLNQIISSSEEVVLRSNPYFKFVDLSDYGYAVVSFSAEKLTVEFVLFRDVFSGKIPENYRVVRFTTPAGSHEILPQR